MKNTVNTYGGVAKGFHWLLFLMMAKRKIRIIEHISLDGVKIGDRPEWHLLKPN